MNHPGKSGLVQDLVLPGLLFAGLGAMTWAVRGCSGFGGMNGCVFAGVAWGAAWWFVARDPSPTQSRPYASGWVILALTVGIGIAGDRGWMQWSSFFEGRLQTNTAAGEWVAIPRAYGFLWLFIAGVPWAGLGACMLAWCSAERPAGARAWVMRLACGLGAAALARMLFEAFPEVFLPLYRSLETRYQDLAANPNLRRLINDNREAITHLGLYLGFLLFEAGRRAWTNAALISIVGLLNGVGWALCQNWKWAQQFWPDARFNFWRCWETSGGISIGLALGVAYYLFNRQRTGASAAPGSHPNLERFGAYLGLVFGLGLSIKNGLKGWANLYVGNQDYWNGILWMIVGPLTLATILGLGIRIWLRPLQRHSDPFPHAHRLVWAVLIIQNIIAQLVTGPHANWSEVAFSLYYLVLFALTAVIILHFQFQKQLWAQAPVMKAGVAAGTGLTQAP